MLIWLLQLIIIFLHFAKLSRSHLFSNQPHCIQKNSLACVTALHYFMLASILFGARLNI